MYHMNITFLPQFNHFKQEKKKGAQRRVRARQGGLSPELTWRDGHRGKRPGAHQGMCSFQGCCVITDS